MEVDLWEELSNERSIRILRVDHLGRPGRPLLECQLRVMDFDHDIMEYSALSYTWGPPEHMIGSDLCCSVASRVEIGITVGDGTMETLHIGQNLFEALEQLHDSWTGSWFWADAICINQNRPSELAVQIPLMGDIYSRARNVIAWLGKRDEMTEKVVSVHNRIANSEQFDLDDTEAAIILHFYQTRRYFTRAWILQEHALPSHVSFLYTDATLPEVEIPRIAISILTRVEKTKDLASEISDTLQPSHSMAGFTALYLWRRFRWSAQPSDPNRQSFCENYYGAQTDLEKYYAFVTCLADAKGCNKANGKHDDEIYCMLGFLEKIRPSDEMRLVVPDYSTPVESVYQEAATRLLQGLRGPCVLSLVCGGLPQRLPGLPSWVPDFSYPRHVPSMQSSRWSGNLRAYNAYPMTRGQRHQATVLGKDLHLKGDCCGIISSRVGSPPQRGFTRTPAESSQAWLDLAAGILLSCRTASEASSNGCGALEAIVASLLHRSIEHELDTEDLNACAAWFFWILYNSIPNDGSLRLQAVPQLRVCLQHLHALDATSDFQTSVKLGRSLVILWDCCQTIGHGR